MGILFALIAGMFSPLVNLTVRKSIDVGGSAKGYFVFQMATSFLFAVLLGPVRQADFSIPTPVALLGILAGLILAMMLFSLGKAVEKGPSGLSFAILSSATVMPGLLMALLFGADLGFVYNGWHALGSALVLGGLFWAGKGLQGMKELNKWILFSSLVFFFHIFLLTLFQWRALWIRQGSFENIHSEWFLAFMFFSCGVVQLLIYLSSERKKPKWGEIFYGAVGGIFNQLSTFFLILATVSASSIENAVIFPIYSVMGIILTNLWGQKLYQEQINWRACQLCAFGLIVSTVDWKTIAATILK